MKTLKFAPSLAAGLLLVSPVLQAKELRDIELRRLFEPTPAERRAERAGRIYIYEGLREDDVERALREQFDRASSMMFIRVQPNPATSSRPSGDGSAPAHYQDDGC
jgi:hypothetical protein